VRYERRTQRLLPRRQFFRRALRHFAFALAVGAVAVGLGTIGYHVVGPLGWVDSFLNASMILSGMGPVDRMMTAPAKIFAALYALFSGLVFIGVSGVIVAPWIHRVFHWFHVDETAG
jgi:hypothetical protein